MSAGVEGLIQGLTENINGVLLGKPDVTRHCAIALLAGEHVLLEDVPGVGKTLVGKALARSIQGEFRRIQFTPDLLPGDITGSTVFNSQTSEFVFNKGPVFANVVLADEINRAPPRTQSALLEAMSDGQVTVDGVTYELPKPFVVIATQNPFEFEGTYPLPESQLDRFLLRISVGYPSREEERRVLATHRSGEPVDQLKSVVSCKDIRQLQQAVREVRFDPSLDDYLLDIVHATRDSDELHVGVSTRGALSLYRAAQAAALFDGREYVVPDDIKNLAAVALSHRVIGRNYLQTGQRDANEQLITRLVDAIQPPE